MSEINQRVACKAIVAKDNRVLILREASTYKDGTNVGRYHLPGGRINPGEPFLRGLSREVAEETGLTVEIGEPIFVGEWFPEIRGVKNHIVAIFFVCIPSGDGVRLSEEHDDFQWVDASSWQQFDLMDPEDRVLTKYFKMHTS